MPDDITGEVIDLLLRSATEHAALGQTRLAASHRARAAALTDRLDAVDHRR